MRAVWTPHLIPTHPTHKRAFCVCRVDMSVEAERRSKLEEWAEKFERVPELSPSELQAWRETGKVVIVDCRNEDEQDVSMIPGAIRRQNLDLDSVQKQGVPVVCYCTVGYRSALEAKSLIAKGLDAYNLRGSIMAWTLDHLPLVDGQDPTQYTMRVHSYSPKWAVQGKDYEAVSYQFPPLRMAWDGLSGLSRFVGGK